MPHPPPPLDTSPPVPVRPQDPDRAGASVARLRASSTVSRRRVWTALAVLLALGVVAVYVLDFAVLSAFARASSTSSGRSGASEILGIPLQPSQAAAKATPSTDLGPRCAPDEAHTPAMTANERKTMLRYVKGQFEGAAWKDGEAEYLEWGSGGSTSTYGTAAKRAYSVEHAVAWCDVVKAWPEMQCMSEGNRWHLLCHDPELELREWGYPKNRSISAATFQEHMRLYVQAPAHFNRTTYDVVLIDGRHRNACAYSILPYLHAGSIVAWHDFDTTAWNRLSTPVHLDAATGKFPKESHIREYWKAAGRVFQEVEHVDALALFRIKPALLQHMQYAA